MLRSMKSCVNETLTTVAQYFGQLIELVFTHEAQVSLQKNSVIKLLNLEGEH